MIFKQFYLESLGHASYLVGSEDTGEALVLDVRRDVETYFAEARSQGLRIRYACDTHQHNDYLSGICELPARTDVQLLAGARAELGYPVRAMDHREQLDMGEVRFELLHTPGHTPEHVSLLVTDRSRGEEPAILFSRGALLVGDLARPDLLGGEAEARRGAEAFCDTLQRKILPLPDFVEVYPTHVAGSLCGGHIGSRLSTTIGYERRMNAMLSNLASKDEFVGHCMDLKDLPDVRRPAEWSAGHIPGAVHLTGAELTRRADELLAGGGRRHLLGVEAIGVAALFLGLVHGRIGIAQQLGRAATVIGAQTDTDAGGDAHFIAIHSEGLFEWGHQPVHHADHGINIADASQQHDELITADARDQVAAIHGRP